MAGESYGKLSTYQPPDFASHLPLLPKHRVKLAMSPTPIHEWKLPDLPSGFKLFIKRDDLTGNLSSGNKIRKLEFLLAEALANGYESVITCGSMQSNHCRATSVATKELGLDCHLLVRSHDIESENAESPANILPPMLNGSQLYIIPWDSIPNGDITEREETLSRLIQNKTGKMPYLIPLGGSNAVGLFGYIEAWREMLDQGILDTVDDIFVACGSAGTLSGLSIANYLTGQKIKIHGVNITEEEGFANMHINNALKEQNITGVAAEDIVDVIDGYAGEGYGKTTIDDHYFLQKVANSTGIFCDLVYTGKALQGMLKEMEINPSRFQGNRILFLHTGGTLGLFDGSYQSCMEETFGNISYPWPKLREEPKAFQN